MIGITTATTAAQRGRYGAKRQSWLAANPRDLLIAIMRKSRRATEDELLVLHWDAVKDNQTMLRTMHEYWFANNFRSLMPEGASADKPKGGNPDAPLTPAQLAGLGAQVDVVRGSLLDMITISGTPIGDLTGSQCRRLGRFASALAEGVPDDAKIRDHVTARRAREIFKGINGVKT